MVLSIWVNDFVTLYADMTVKFGNETPGGTRISHLSGIDGRRKVPIILTRGKTALYTVDPLPDAPAPPTPEQVAAATREQVTEWWHAHPAIRPQLTARAEELKAADPE